MVAHGELTALHMAHEEGDGHHAQLPARLGVHPGAAQVIVLLLLCRRKTIKGSSLRHGPMGGIEDQTAHLRNMYIFIKKAPILVY